MEAGRQADANRRRFQCDSRGHRLPQAVFMAARCSVSAGAARTLSGDVGNWLYGCVPVVARGRSGTLHILGLLSAGVPKQSRYTNRPLPVISGAGKSTGKLRDRQGTSRAGKALRPHSYYGYAIRLAAQAPTKETGGPSTDPKRCIDWETNPRGCGTGGRGPSFGCEGRLRLRHGSKRRTAAKA